MGLDVDGSRHVELGGTRAVANLPHVEQLGEAATVPWLERCLDRVRRGAPARG
jgi:hypothetical protein